MFCFEQEHNPLN